jgi:hypothetical protein
MAKDTEHFAHQEWIGFVQPVGLVVSAPALLAAQAQVNRNIAGEHARFLACLPRDADGELIAEIRDLAEFTQAVLGWDAADLMPVPDSATLPEDLASLEVVLPEYHETLRPTYIVKEFKPSEAKSPWLLLVKEIPSTVALDEPHAESDRNWQASPHAKFERLLRETQVPVGLLSNGKQLRLVYAPRGETSGYVTFSVAEMVQVAGRPIFAALHMLLSSERLFSLPENQRLPSILVESRKYQNTVSTKLAEQVLAALYELLRGFQSANDQRHGELLKEILEDDPNHVYSGLLTVLMRLVFVLYAEDRGLMSSDSVYANHYSVTGLFDRLRAEAGRYPDTMDHRYGAWSGLLTLFRLIFEGGSHSELQIPRRRGYLFDPDRYPFLEGRDRGSSFENTESLDVPRVSDGVIFRVLSNLLVLDGERLSYRTLDVEQIGSVYETIMGFNLEVAQGRSIAIKPTKSHGAPAALNLDGLLATPANKRAERYKELTDRELSGAALNSVKAANSIDDLLAALDKQIARNVTPNVVPAGAMVFQPSDERRRSGSHYTPRSLTEPIVRTTLQPILKRLVDSEAELPPEYEPSREDKSRYTKGELAEKSRLAKLKREAAEAGRKVGIPHPAQILDLKVCDPAMGSGAFLVETCRQLGDELVKSWRAHNLLPTDIPADEDELLYARRQIAQRCLYGVDKNPMAVDLAKLSLWLATLAKDHPFTFLDHSLRHGDSLVGLTRRQIIGFHWEPKKQKSFAEELIQKRLDRATEARAQILNAREDVPYRDQEQRLAVADEALNVVRMTGNACVSSFFARSKKKDREDRCEELLALVSDWYASGHNPSKRGPITEAAASLQNGDHPIPPFHWEIEFPEVFSPFCGGFNAFVGNPPFLGGKRISTALGLPFRDWIKEMTTASNSNSDLVSFFFRRAFGLLRPGGTFGLIATNTIRQGDTRLTGLMWICDNDGIIYNARRRMAWPGVAAVVVSVVHIYKRLSASDGAAYCKPFVLDAREVSQITGFLFHTGSNHNPHTLLANANKSFIGCFLRGMGFTFDDRKEEASTLDEMRELLNANPANRECIFPYIGGDEVNSNPTHDHHRYAINFGEMPLKRDSTLPPWCDTSAGERKKMLREGIVPADYPGAVSEDWPDLLAVVRRKVKPGRDELKDVGVDATHKRKWWLYANSRPELHKAIEGLNEVLMVGRNADRMGFTFLPNGMVYSDQAVIFPLRTFACYASCQSRAHEEWVRFFASSMKDDLRYSPTDAFETFPFPAHVLETSNRDKGSDYRDVANGTRARIVELESSGKAYFEYRRDLMITRNEGLTKTYNRFHDPSEQSSDIVQMRLLHLEMDRSVLKAYGWADLAAAARCEFLLDYEDEDEEGSSNSSKKKPWRLRWTDDFRDEVLARLLELNEQRAEEERFAGLAVAHGALNEVKAKDTRKKKSANSQSHESAQQEMF